MPSLSRILTQLLAEVHSSVEAVSLADAAVFVERLRACSRVFVTGQGRTGLIARTFAMRLAQLGLPAFVVGETTTPAIRAGDALVACSGSGTTAITCYQAERAKSFGAAVFAVTARPGSRLAEVADVLLTIPVASSEQLGNARFEQALLLLLDALAIALAQASDIPPSAIWDHHANLE